MSRKSSSVVTTVQNTVKQTSQNNSVGRGLRNETTCQLTSVVTVFMTPIADAGVKLSLLIVRVQKSSKPEPVPLFTQRGGYGAHAVMKTCHLSGE